MDGSDVWLRAFVIAPMAAAVGGVAGWTLSLARPETELGVLVWAGGGVALAFVATCWALGLFGGEPPS
ncbi:MAG: hypothetical protein OXG35_01440 [Acidobacteria bacterium]|nr:hypothetical protein [Acidobacteriota bacterium]